MKTISILGSTGSIGSQTLDVISRNRHDFTIKYLTTNTRIDILEQQIRQFSPENVVIANEKSYHEFCKSTIFNGGILCGEEAIIQAASDNNDIVMSSLVGFSGVFPTLAAIQAGSTIALANKETLVSAGEIIMSAARNHNTPILAVDSEHSAILQSIVGENTEDIEKIILTASGGPFRTMNKDLFSAIKPEDALKHPNWTMGSKITIDSATLMNKGFEVIEAHWLFSMAPEKIDVIIHPQSIIHSMVQFNDGSIKAQLGTPDMRIPIAYALYFPRHGNFDFPRLDFTKLKDLTFEQPNTNTFPCLRFAYDCMKRGGTSPAILNASNEIAVDAFLRHKCSFTDIFRSIETALTEIETTDNPSIYDIENADKQARQFVQSLLQVS